MLETTLVALQDISLEKIFDDNGRKTLCSEFPQIMQQVLATFSDFHCYRICSISSTYRDLCFRVSRVFKAEYVSQAWGDQFHTREQLLGKCSMKKRMLIASALCSSTGPLFEIIVLLFFSDESFAIWLDCKMIYVVVSSCCCQTQKQYFV